MSPSQFRPRWPSFRRHFRTGAGEPRRDGLRARGRHAGELGEARGLASRGSQRGLLLCVCFCFVSRTVWRPGESPTGASRAAGSPGGPPGIFPWRSRRPPGHHNANAVKTVCRFVCGRGKNRNSTIWGRFPAQPGPGGAWAPAGAPLDVHRFSVATSSSADAAQTETPKLKSWIRLGT